LPPEGGGESNQEAIKKGVAADYSKCDSKLNLKWGKAEQKAIDKGTACIDSVSDTAIQSFVTAHTDAVAAALDGGTLAGGFPATGQTTAYGTGSDGDVQAGAALSYTDNGDGTITDNNTGLMWEKKDDSGGIHDKGNTYTWCGASCFGTNEMDGTITSTFLDTLNDVGGGGASCFAGYCDWRVPNYKELTSILDLEVFFPSVDPAFHQSGTCTGCLDVTLASCTCTDSSNYWSSTSTASNSVNAWGVSFNEGRVVVGVKAGTLRVRAVRGGL